MKKFLEIMGVLFLFLIVVGATGYSYIAYTGSTLDKTSKDFVDTSVPQIVSGWDANKLSNFIDQQAFDKNGITKDQLNAVFNKYKALGTLKNYNGSSGQSSISFTNSKKTVTAFYTAKADFTSGPADIKVSLSYDEGQWKILSLYINSPVFSH